MEQKFSLGKLNLGDLKLGRHLYQKRAFLIVETFCLGLFLFMVSCTGVPLENSPSDLSVLGCPSNIVEVIDGSGDALVVSWVEPTGEDSSGTVITILEQSHNPGDTFNVGTTEVAYMFTDEGGSSDSCLFTVTVSLDLSSGDVVITDCPSGLVEDVTAGATSVVVTWTEPSAEDSSGTVITILAQSHSSGDAFDIGLTEVLYTFAAVNGLSSVCSFIVTVSQAASTGVTIVDDCPSDIVEDAANGMNSVVVTWTEPSAEDSNGTVITFLEQSHNSGDTFNVGTTGVAYTFTDNAANTAECTFTVLVRAGKIYSFYLVDNNTEPSELNPFLIETKEDLEMLATVINNEATFNINGTDISYAVSDYRLENSLDLSVGYTHMPIGDCKTDVNGAEGLCGDNDDVYFSGNFNGNEKTLTGLTYNASHPSLGLFGLISNATLSNFILENPSVMNTSTSFFDSTGLLVGTSDGNSDISDITILGGSVEGGYNVGGLVGRQVGSGNISTATVTADVTGRDRNMGGLVGYQLNSVVTGSTFAGTITGGSYVGGLVGYQLAGSIVSESVVTGAVNGFNRIGGLVGVQTGSSVLMASYMTGAVTGMTSYVGGLVGYQSGGGVLASYATGNVNGSNYVGGVVGQQFGSGSFILATYATGDVDGDSHIGGLAGHQNSGEIRGSYATGSVTGQTLFGGFVGSRSGGTSQSCYWNTDVWMGSSAFGEGQAATELKTPVAYGTGTLAIYATWNKDKDNNNIDYWDFGTAMDFPVLAVSGLQTLVEQRANPKLQ